MEAEFVAAWLSITFEQMPMSVPLKKQSKGCIGSGLLDVIHHHGAAGTKTKGGPHQVKKSIIERMVPVDKYQVERRIFATFHMELFVKVKEEAHGIVRPKGYALPKRRRPTIDNFGYPVAAKRVDGRQVTGTDIGHGGGHYAGGISKECADLEDSCRCEQTHKLRKRELGLLTRQLSGTERRPWPRLEMLRGYGLAQGSAK